MSPSAPVTFRLYSRACVVLICIGASTWHCRSHWRACAVFPVCTRNSRTLSVGVSGVTGVGCVCGEACGFAARLSPSAALRTWLPASGAVSLYVAA